MKCLASSEPQRNNAWLFDLCKLLNSVAVSTSLNDIAIFDSETLQQKNTIQKAHGDIITSVLATPSKVEFYTSSRDRTVKLWDSRTSKSCRTLQAPAGVLSISHHTALDKLAVGTELYGSDAVVTIFDARSTKPLVTYADSHGEDVTALSWHPSNNLLLSGGQDGIVNVFDTTVVDEDDAVLQVLNHGSSIHLARFYGKNEVFALSHMETASLYKLSYAQEDIPRDEIKEFGDLRSKLHVDYCIAFDSGPQSTIYCGDSTGVLSIIPFNHLELDFEVDKRLDLTCSTEIVRSVHLDAAPHSLSGPLLYTAGEDGILRVFSRSQADEDDETRLARKRERRESKSARKRDQLRFEPY